MAFAATVERWRPIAREHAKWASTRYGVQLDEHDLLALIRHESVSKECPNGGDPTAISGTGCRGLGQFAGGTLKDYNAQNPGHELTWADLIDPAHASGQIRAMAWCVASSRKTVRAWGMPDAKSNADLWADVRYGWGGGHLRAAIDNYKAEHGGKSPTFAELEASSPAAYDESGDGEIDIRPFQHARAVHNIAAKDRGEAPIPIPFPVPDAGSVADCLACCCAARHGDGSCPRLAPVVAKGEGG